MYVRMSSPAVLVVVVVMAVLMVRPIQLLPQGRARSYSNSHARFTVTLFFGAIQSTCLRSAPLQQNPSLEVPLSVAGVRSHEPNTKLTVPLFVFAHSGAALYNADAETRARTYAIQHRPRQRKSFQEKGKVRYVVFHS
jgi:hypothetical protein